jgi:hypothetical protein
MRKLLWGTVISAALVLPSVAPADAHEQATAYELHGDGMFNAGIQIDTSKASFSKDWSDDNKYVCKYAERKTLWVTMSCM